jgi:benzoyl-CoA reductase/2-hydroxyglutaryl-CoA dehydratase subunit BcrC/BadD/HgdB
MPKRFFLDELRTLMGYIDQRKTYLRKRSPRLLITSDRLDNPEYLDLIEGMGSLIAMDDMDTGSRYFWTDVEINSSNVIYDIAKSYLNRKPCPRMFFWDKQIDQITQWVEEYRINGVLNLPQVYSYPRMLGSSL